MKIRVSHNRILVELIGIKSGCFKGIIRDCGINIKDYAEQDMILFQKRGERIVKNGRDHYIIEEQDVLCVIDEEID